MLLVRENMCSLQLSLMWLVDVTFVSVAFVFHVFLCAMMASAVLVDLRVVSKNVTNGVFHCIVFR